ncbi:MAG TPA: hypothetical protein VIQ53_14050 [Inquilinus sp.]
MPHRILPLPFKPHRRDGPSERRLASPDETMNGAVRGLNAIEPRLKGLDRHGRPRRRRIAARFDAAIIRAVRDLAGSISQRHRERDAWHCLILYDAFSPWSGRLQSEAHNWRPEGYGDATKPTSSRLEHMHDGRN